MSQDSKFILSKKNKTNILKMLNFYLDNEMEKNDSDDIYKLIPDKCFLKVKHLKDILNNNASYYVVDPGIFIYKLRKNDYMFDDDFELGNFNMFEEPKNSNKATSSRTYPAEWLLPNNELYDFLKKYFKKNSNNSLSNKDLLSYQKSLSINKSSKKKSIKKTKKKNLFQKILKFLF
jgi:hypothetical protein|uniref:Uncharacterized protein n=1 Tax=Mimiviridae sp. ChoanoV1 TaxID=2596887 RepID=A0A5B8IFL5_9VIRU|nr:hypothetical protein 4_78 [Mimiviridae sp. ChoanoV1]